MRRIFAFIALFSGLLAVGAPANAAALEQACEQVASADFTQSGKRTQCSCRFDKRSKSSKRTGSKSCKRPKSVTIYIPTVQLGVDRAYE